jgi:hypothetical protein
MLVRLAAQMRPLICSRPTPVDAGVSATYARGERDPSQIGSVRNGLGMPLKGRQIHTPFANVVAKASMKGLCWRWTAGRCCSP